MRARGESVEFGVKAFLCCQYRSCRCFKQSKSSIESPRIEIVYHTSRPCRLSGAAGSGSPCQGLGFDLVSWTPLKHDNSRRGLS